jgi:putative ABC transport system permease protein
MSLHLSWGAVWSEAMRALSRNRVRSILATSGISIGIAAVVWVIAVGQAATSRAQEALSNLGDNLVWVEAGSRNVNGVRTGTKGTTSLTLEDAEAIAREVPLLRRVSPQADGGVQAISATSNWATRYRGVGPDFVAIKRWPVAEGVNFTDEHVLYGSAVCLLGATLRKRLFGDGEAVGRFVRLKDQPFEVIGVLSVKGQSATGTDQDDVVLLPYTTAQRRLRGRGPVWLDDVLCSAASPEAVNAAVDQVTALMRQRHRIRPGEEDDFNIRRPDEVIKAEIESTRTFSTLLVALATISLLVGGIGVMNVMLVSVTQRTREIGLRLAVGATDLHVRAQFLGEAMLLSGAGGVAGVLLGLLGCLTLGSLLGWKLPLPVEGFAVGAAFSIAVGLFFGVYPAHRAATLDPIEALRHE